MPSTTERPGHRPRTALALFLAIGVIWGMPYLFIRIAVEQVSPAVLVLARTGLGAALLVPLAWRAGGFSAVRRHPVAVPAFALIEIVGPWLLLSDAERHLTSSLTGLLVATVPMVALLVARVTGEESAIHPLRVLGLAIGAAGVGLLGTGDLHAGSGWAVAEVILAAVGYGVAPRIASRWLRDVPDLALTATCLVLAAVVVAPLAALTWPAQLPGASALWSMVVLAVVCTAVAFPMFFRLIHSVGSARATLVAYVNPVVAVALGIAVLDEPLTARLLAGAAAVLAGTALAARRWGRAQPSSPGAVVAEP